MEAVEHRSLVGEVEHTPPVEVEAEVRAQRVVEEGPQQLVAVGAVQQMLVAQLTVQQTLVVEVLQGCPRTHR